MQWNRNAIKRADNPCNAHNTTTYMHAFLLWKNSSMDPEKSSTKNENPG